MVSVSDPTLPPELWRPLYDAIGVDFGYRQLATYIGMDHTTLRRLLLGGSTSAHTVQVVADALRVTPERIRELRGESAALTPPPFVLPDEAGRLNDNERRVIRAMVRALLAARDESAQQQSQEQASAVPPAAPHDTPPEPATPPADLAQRRGEKAGHADDEQDELAAAITAHEQLKAAARPTDPKAGKGHAEQGEAPEGGA